MATHYGKLVHSEVYPELYAQLLDALYACEERASSSADEEDFWNTLCTWFDSTYVPCVCFDGVFDTTREGWLDSALSACYQLTHFLVEKPDTTLISNAIVAFQQKFLICYAERGSGNAFSLVRVSAGWQEGWKKRSNGMMIHVRCYTFQAGVVEQILRHHCDEVIRED